MKPIWEKYHFGEDVCQQQQDQQQEQEEEAEKPSEAENPQMRQSRELRILSSDWFCFFSLCVNKNIMMLFERGLLRLLKGKVQVSKGDKDLSVNQL